MAHTKREQLIAAAQIKFYQQGVARTTLADIAAEAQIPLGNVYYHFRTKEAILVAVIEARVQRLHTRFAQWDSELTDPRERLITLIHWERAAESSLTRYGCPYGSLMQEVTKEETQVEKLATGMLETYLEWTEKQFRQLGKDEQEAKDLSFDMIAWFQGTILLSAGFHSRSILERKLQRMEQWINSL